MADTTITSIPEFVERVVLDARKWGKVFPWFRGERDVLCSSLLPRVFRKKYDENNLLQSFRRRAHLLNLPVVPPRAATDQWLFLARHVGLPTRLLDWSDGALIALYFALITVEEYETARSHFAEGSEAPHATAVVWMLNPVRLNWIALLFDRDETGLEIDPGETEPTANYYPLPWHDPQKHGVNVRNIAYENVARAWQLKTRGVQLPVALEPDAIHPRMLAQHSYFTIHGRDERRLDAVLSSALDHLKERKKCSYELADLLLRYEIKIPIVESLVQLRTLGVADSTIMPDADSLADELSRFMHEEWERES